MTDNALAKLNGAVRMLAEARHMLAEARTIDEILDVRDRATAVREFAKVARGGLELQNHGAELKLRAERKAGELFRQLGREQGGNGRFGSSNVGRTASEYAQVIEQADTNRQTANRWQLIADLPEPLFEATIAETKAAGKELTSSHMVQVAARETRKQEPVITPPLPDNTFRCIVIDPPWPIKKIERDVRPLQGEHLDYPTMTLEEIAALPIPDLADQNGCHVYLWVTQKYLPAGIDLFDKWGVRYECLLTWVKNVGFTPFSWMYNAEHVLFGRIGSLAVQRKGLKLAFDAPVSRHSEKPEAFYSRALEASPAPRLELFARQSRDGFLVWGNEVI